MTDQTLIRIRDLPGPPGFPVIGNLLQIDSSRLHLIAEEWSRQYGEYYRIRIGRREFLVVANAEVIAKVLRDRPDGFQRTSRLGLVTRELGCDGLFSANGERWRRQRPMVMVSLDPGHTKAFFPSLVRVTERFEKRWRRASAAGKEIDLQGDLMRYTVDVTAGLAFGVDVNTVESDDDIIQQHLDKVMPAIFKRLLSPFPYWHYLKLPRDYALDRHVAALRIAVNDFIGQARQRMARDPALRARPSSLIEAMIAARDISGSNVDDEDVAGNVLTMLLAGEDTTANTLAWMIYLLSQNPGARRQVAEEVRSALGDDRLPTDHGQASCLPFVEACAQETMRLKPVVPILFAEAAQDRVVGGIHVPAGSLIMCLMRPDGMRERYFPNAAHFDPTRWLGRGPQAKFASAKRINMPFGAGPRLCPGRYLAMLEIKMVIAMLFAGFDIERVSPTDGGEPKERLASTMAPVGLRALLKPRADT